MEETDQARQAFALKIGDHSCAHAASKGSDDDGEAENRTGATESAPAYMVMNNDGRGGLFALNSLRKPADWSVKEGQELIELSSMDFVMANPPFGTKIKVEGQEILEQYDLAHAWTKRGDDKWIMDGSLRAAMPPEVLFIERCVQFLKPGVGKLGLVVPDGILGNPDYEYIRYWILANCQVLASVDLPVETFLPRTGTQTSVLILRRKSEQEKLAQSLSNNADDEQIFMAIANAVGKDRRGKITARMPHPSSRQTVRDCASPPP